MKKNMRIACDHQKTSLSHSLEKKESEKIPSENVINPEKNYFLLKFN